jgi:serine acetyltransferase
MAAFRQAHRWQAAPSRSAASRCGVTVYKVLTTWLLGVELPAETTVGPGLRLAHPQGIVVNGEARLGARCLLRANSTLGNVVDGDGRPGPSPVVGDDVELGVGVIVIGAVTIGDGARVGAGAVVLRDVPAGAVAVGNPARILPVAPRAAA